MMSQKRHVFDMSDASSVEVDNLQMMQERAGHADSPTFEYERLGIEINCTS